MATGIKLHLEALRLGEQVESGLMSLETAADEMLQFARNGGDHELLAAVVDGLKDNPWNFTPGGYPAYDCARRALDKWQDNGARAR